jgi:hypothetical protein
VSRFSGMADPVGGDASPARYMPRPPPENQRAALMGWMKDGDE